MTKPSYVDKQLQMADSDELGYKRMFGRFAEGFVGYNVKQFYIIHLSVSFGIKGIKFIAQLSCEASCVDTYSRIERTRLLYNLSFVPLKCLLSYQILLQSARDEAYLPRWHRVSVSLQLSNVIQLPH